MEASLLVCLVGSCARTYVITQRHIVVTAPVLLQWPLPQDGCQVPPHHLATTARRGWDQRGCGGAARPGVSPWLQASG